MMRPVLAAIVTIACAASLGGCAATGPNRTPDAGGVDAWPVVQRQIDAFNRHDVDALAANVTSDFMWLTVTEDGAVPEVEGREQFVEGMRGYFGSLPSVRSVVEDRMTSGQYAAFRERVVWRTGDGEERTQSAFAVYQVRDGKIRRAWYFPADE